MYSVECGGREDLNVVDLSLLPANCFPNPFAILSHESPSFTGSSRILSASPEYVRLLRREDYIKVLRANSAAASALA
jgi:hypothetical protein